MQYLNNVAKADKILSKK